MACNVPGGKRHLELNFVMDLYLVKTSVSVYCFTDKLAGERKWCL